jgi:hypothetical protein
MNRNFNSQTEQTDVVEFIFYNRIIIEMNFKFRGIEYKDNGNQI